MSDFLSRLAARAVGDVPLAQPSLAAADAIVPTADAAKEVLPTVPVARATPVAPEVRSEEPEVPRAQPQRVAEEDPRPERSEIVESRVLHERIVSSPAPVRDTAESEPHPAPVRAPAAATVVAATPVPAAPAARRVFESRLEHVQTVATVVRDEPPVRVHIGRLEVRANLEQPLPAPPEPRARRATSEGLSLSDYLRGRRTA